MTLHTTLQCERDINNGTNLSKENIVHQRTPWDPLEFFVLSSRALAFTFLSADALSVSIPALSNSGLLSR